MSQAAEGKEAFHRSVIALSVTPSGDDTVFGLILNKPIGHGARWPGALAEEQRRSFMDRLCNWAQRVCQEAPNTR